MPAGRPALGIYLGSHHQESWHSGAPAGEQPGKQQDDEEHNENDEQKLGDPRGCRCDAGEAEDGRNDRNHKKDQCPD
jgi:hypothetical protein